MISSARSIMKSILPSVGHYGPPHAKALRQLSKESGNSVVVFGGDQDDFSNAVDLNGTAFVAGSPLVQNDILVPLCRNHDGGLIVIGSDLALYAGSAAARTSSDGADIFVISPEGLGSGGDESMFSPHGVNPLACLNPERSDFITLVNRIAGILVQAPTPLFPGNDRGHNYFAVQAARLIASFIAVEVAESFYEKRAPSTLRDVFRMLCLPSDTLQHLIWDRFILVENGRYGPYHASVLHLGTSFYGMAADTWSDIASTAVAACDWLTDARYADVVCSNTVEPRLVFEGGASVYINIPKEVQERRPSILDLIVFALTEPMMTTETRTLIVIRDLPAVADNSKVLWELLHTTWKRNASIVASMRSVEDLKRATSGSRSNDWLAQCRTKVVFERFQRNAGKRLWNVEGLDTPNYLIEVVGAPDALAADGSPGVRLQNMIAEVEPELRVPLEPFDCWEFNKSLGPDLTANPNEN